MEGGRVTKWGEGLFFLFLFCFSLFKPTKICFGSTNMDISYWEKSISHWEKIRRNDFAPTKNVPVMHLFSICTPTIFCWLIFPPPQQMLMLMLPLGIVEIWQVRLTFPNCLWGKTKEQKPQKGNKKGHTNQKQKRKILIFMGLGDKVLEIWPL